MRLLQRAAATGRQSQEKPGSQDTQKSREQVAKAQGSGSRQTEAREPVRTIRARLTVRGFKDQQKADIDRYAGTSSRTSQTLMEAKISV